MSPEAPKQCCTVLSNVNISLTCYQRMFSRIPLKRIGTAKFRIDHDQAAKYVSPHFWLWNKSMAKLREETENEKESLAVLSSLPK